MSKKEEPPSPLLFYIAKSPPQPIGQSLVLFLSQQWLTQHVTTTIKIIIVITTMIVIVITVLVTLQASS